MEKGVFASELDRDLAHAMNFVFASVCVPRRPHSPISESTRLIVPLSASTRPISPLERVRIIKRLQVHQLTICAYGAFGYVDTLFIGIVVVGVM